MYKSVWIRSAIILLFGLFCWWLPGGRGWIWGFDQWLWTGLRDFQWPIRHLPLIAAGSAVVMGWLGTWIPIPTIQVRRPAIWIASIMAIAGLIFWYFRVLSWLGDLGGVDRLPQPWWTLEAAEPLGAFVFHYTHKAALALEIQPSVGHQLATVIFSVTAVAALFLWTRLVTPSWPLLFAMMLTPAYNVIFFGYPEKGTPKSIALTCWYIYFATRALQEKTIAPLVNSSLSISLAGLLHGSGFCWLPAHAWMVWRHFSWKRRLLAAVIFMLPLTLVAGYAISGAPYAGGKWGNVAAPWFWFKKYCVTNCGYHFFSRDHLVDIFNGLIELSPMALLCLPEALWRARRDRHIIRWLALGSLGFLFLSAIWFPVFGYFNDWDIFATTPLVISALTAYIAATELSERQFRQLGFAWITTSLIHTYSMWRFFQVNR